MKKGEDFDEMYMIFNGSVTLSLDKKDVAEYFRLYQSNYFGDYQIILGYRSSECYKSSVDSPTYCFCLKKKTFLDLMSISPESAKIFTERAVLRRKEFRRIKRQF
jgi:signal-transduction protein with cAMP-binding, CBS, and nucleotidyltransferase domain